MERAGKILVGAVLVYAFCAGLWSASAEADAGCAQRSAAHIAKHGGLAADSAWHVANGELPTCGSESSGGGGNWTSNERSSSKDDDGKSRFCRARWWC